jgi:hypothetical protein
MTKTAAKTSADLRENLRTAYLIAFDNFATDAKEIADALQTDTKHANAVLQALLNKNLLAEPDHVNGEKKLTWQAQETYDSITRRQAIARFNKAFPKGEALGGVIPVSNGRRGATGPKYTKDQIKTAIKMRKAGESWKAIGAALDIRATAYLAKLLKPQLEAKPKARRVVRRSTKAGA